jgi:hypothetical protein
MRKITFLIAAIVTTLSIGVAFVGSAPAVYAQDKKEETTKEKIKCEPGNTDPACKPAGQADLLKLIKNIIGFISAGVGVMITFMIAYSGFRYLSSGANSSQVTDAKNHLNNAILALILWIFGMALLNFIVPGGLTGLF